jgi:hypothetical protein
MGVGWGAAALVAGMAIVVVLGLVLVSLASRPGPVWRQTLAVLLGLAVVAATAWLVFAPVTFEGTDGTVTCHSPTTADKHKVGYDGACQAPATQRRWLVFGPLGLVGAAALVGLLAPGLRRQATSETDEAVADPDETVDDPDEAANRPSPTGTANANSQTDQPT